MTVSNEEFRRGAQLPGDCVLAHRKHLCHVRAAQDHDADQTNAKVAALDKRRMAATEAPKPNTCEASVAQRRFS